MPGEIPSLAADPVRLSALAAVLAWAAGAAALLAAPRRRRARVGWLAAWLAAATHVVVALDVAHGWSHADVLRHADAAAGFGPGVYANGPFLLLWLADAGWRLARPGRVPRGWTVAVHGFLAFLVFNATVVYGSWVARGVGVAVFVGLGWLWRRSDYTDAGPPHP